MVRPRSDARLAANREVEAAAQGVVQGGGGRDDHLGLRPRGVEAVQARDQPAHREGRGRAHPQGPQREGPAADLGRRVEPVEGEAHRFREGPGRGRRDDIAADPHEQALAEPRLQHGDLTADGPVGQPELGRRGGVAAGSGGDLEDAQRMKGWKTAHRTSALASVRLAHG